VLSTSLVAVLPLAGLPTRSLKAAAVPASTPESFTSRVSGSVSRLTSFSGVSQDAPGKPRQGTFTITFAIYPVPEVGDPLWTETQQMTATPEGSHTEPRSSAGGGLPATVLDPLNRFNDAPVSMRRTLTFERAAPCDNCRPSLQAGTSPLPFLRRSHSTGGVRDRDNYLRGEI